MSAFLLTAALTFCCMELVSYGVHRFVYHKLLWTLHRSHHTPRTGPFELNDVFPIFFALVSIAVIVVGLTDGPFSPLLAVGVGVTAYGVVYFVIHDLYVHRRVRAFSLRIPFLLALKKAHAVHHRTGGEPYGLLLFFSPRTSTRIDVREEDAV